MCCQLLRINGAYCEAYLIITHYWGNNSHCPKTSKWHQVWFVRMPCWMRIFTKKNWYSCVHHGGSVESEILCRVQMIFCTFGDCLFMKIFSWSMVNRGGVGLWSVHLWCVPAKPWTLSSPFRMIYVLCNYHLQIEKKVLQLKTNHPRPSSMPHEALGLGAGPIHTSVWEQTDRRHWKHYLSQPSDAAAIFFSLQV